MRPLAAVLALLIAGCVSTSNMPPLQYYVLADLGTASDAHRASERGRALLVHPASVNAFYDTQRLVYSRADGQRAYYQFAAWTERPARAFSDLLSQRLGAALTTSGVRGDLILQTRLEELYHDARAKPGAVNITVSAELVDAAGRRIGERRFSRSVPAAEENAAAAVAAANRAVTELLDDIAAWLDGYASSRSARA